MYIKQTNTDNMFIFTQKCKNTLSPKYVCMCVCIKVLRSKIQTQVFLMANDNDASCCCCFFVFNTTTKISLKINKPKPLTKKYKIIKNFFFIFCNSCRQKHPWLPLKICFICFNFCVLFPALIFVLILYHFSFFVVVFWEILKSICFLKIQALMLFL